MTVATGIVLATQPPSCDNLAMRATDATAEVFVTAFKALQPRQREAVSNQMLDDADISADIADTLALEARRHQPRESFRHAVTGLVASRTRGQSRGMAKLRPHHPLFQ